jgi:hypothetical protein
VKSIVIVLKPEAARAWHGAAARNLAGADPAVVNELKKLAATVGVELQPTHPGAQHDMLLPYFTANIDDDRAETVLRALRSCPWVDAAYVQPTSKPA